MKGDRRQVAGSDSEAPSVARSRAIPGTAALALALGCGRWGNYLVVSLPPIPGGIGLSQGPPYLLDILVLGASVRILFNGSQRLPRLNTSIIFSLIFGLYVFLRFGLAEPINFDAVRDFAPYAYVLLIPLMAMAFMNASADSIDRTSRHIYFALVFHACWVAVVLVAPDAFASAPVLNSAPSVRMFDIRSDFDAACCAILVALTSLNALKMRKSLIGARGLTLLLGLFTVVGIHSRVGLVILVVLLPLVASTVLRSKRAATTVVVAFPLLMLLAFAVLPNTIAGQRLLLEQVDTSNAQAGAGAEGTTNARRMAWSTVYRYTNEDSTRALVGVGFGANFMSDSGALTQLVGSNDPEEQVRSPHNFLVGTYARLGLLGALLIAGALLPVFWRVRRSVLRDERGLQSLAALVVVALGIASVVGVILESPFAAVPFYWCAGVLIGGSAARVTRQESADKAGSRSAGNSE